MASRNLVAAMCLLAALASVASRVNAQASAAGDKTKKEALEWIDSYARFQVLFSKDDMKKLRDRVAAMTPEEAADWWKKTTRQRLLLTSPQWQETENWLRKFLDVQAKYSDED